MIGERLFGRSRHQREQKLNNDPQCRNSMPRNYAANKTPLLKQSDHSKHGASSALLRGSRSVGCRCPPAGESPTLFLRLFYVQGVEFAAEGGTADPCFLLRVGKRKGMSEPVADVPGGSAGRCGWPSKTGVVTGVTESDVRSSGFEVCDARCDQLLSSR